MPGHGRPTEHVACNWSWRKTALLLGVTVLPACVAQLGLRCRQKRKFKATTHSAHRLPVAENVLEQVFEPTRPNEVWTGDITYIPTDEGWL